MERTVIQCNMFTAMLANKNHHFLEEACKLLLRERGVTAIEERVAYDKLLSLMKQVKGKEKWLERNNIQYLCTE